MEARSGRLSEVNGGFGWHQGKIANSEIRHFPSEFNALRTTEIRRRAAALAARRAVAGPCTTEYGPCMDGKRKIVRTLKTATTANSHPMRPEIMSL
jgi:hypothetical protein